MTEHAVKDGAPRGFIFVTTRELDVGMATRDCGYCGAPVTVRMPKLREAFRDKALSPSLRLHLNDLTPLERELFDVLYAAYPNAISRATLVEQFGVGTVRQRLWKSRPKLRAHGWEIVNGIGTLRLEQISQDEL